MSLDYIDSIGKGWGEDTLGGEGSVAVAMGTVRKELDEVSGKSGGSIFAMPVYPLLDADENEEEVLGIG